MPIKNTRFWLKKKYRIMFGILLALIIFRLFLPYIVLNYVNKKLAEMPGYYGHVEDIDIALYRGAYQIKNIYLVQKDSATQVETEFFTSKVIDLSIEWGALFKGRLAGELDFFLPHLYLLKTKLN